MKNKLTRRFLTYTLGVGIILPSSGCALLSYGLRKNDERKIKEEYRMADWDLHLKANRIERNLDIERSVRDKEIKKLRKKVDDLYKIVDSLREDGE